MTQYQSLFKNNMKESSDTIDNFDKMITQENTRTSQNVRISSFKD